MEKEEKKEKEQNKEVQEEQEELENNENIKKESKEKEKNVDYKDMAMRALADLQNYKKRIEDENREFKKMLTFDVVSEFLDIYNNLKQAESFIPDDQKEIAWVKGVIMISNQFKDRLVQFGIEEFNCVGCKFDHNTMDATFTECDESKEEDIVLKQITPGFKIGDKIVQYAKVVVNKKNKTN